MCLKSLTSCFIDRYRCGHQLHHGHDDFPAELFHTLRRAVTDSRLSGPRLLNFNGESMKTYLAYLLALTILPKNTPLLIKNIILCLHANILLQFSFGVGIVGVKGLFVGWACMQVVSSLCCIFLLKQKQESPPDGTTSSTSVTPHNPIKDRDNAVDDDLKPSPEVEMDSINSSENTNSESTNEKTRLVQSQLTNQKEEVRISVYGWEIMKLMDFWLLMATFIIGSTLTKLFMSNFGTYLRSFDHEDHLHVLMSTGPWCLAGATLIFGLISDFYIDKIPRLLFLVFLALCNVPIYFAFIFKAYDIVFLYIVAYTTFASNGVYFLFGPVLIAELFWCGTFWN